MKEELQLSPIAYHNSLAWHSDNPMLWYALGGLWLRIREWLWNRGGRKLYWSIGRRAPVYKWWIRWCDPGFMPCDGCGYVWEWAQNDGWFVCEDAGTSYSPGEPDIHWFEGTQTCPRCRRCWYYSDSD